ncbi:stage V sporulation protein AB [Anaerosolibacter carboniphilus]|uniref:Stage V sporulation protein AB n=2 Tax=Anaerosolibacter carboniphilus TaxID=1417629 RepID=A0A841KRI6_9FIRM|nr:stage V sporulation protein AB [Anaerosolibacter carboniphilus]
MLKFVAAFVGLAEGIVVGSAVVAFITLLDIVPRLAQLTDTENWIRFYEIVIISSGTIISFAWFSNTSLNFGKTILVVIGLLMGVFVGLLASALTEVTNVIPVIVNRFRLHDYIGYVLGALVTGKVIGSLIYWLCINK